jgi:hypothetical protein
VSFPLQVPGERAGVILGELEEALGTNVGLGSDAVVQIELEAGSREEAVRRVLDVVTEADADGYFDLTDLRPPMCVSVRRYVLEAGDLAELASRVQHAYAPLLAEAPGFIAYHLFKQDERTVVSVRVFGEQGELEAADRLSRDWEREHLAEFQLRQVEEITGDVLATRRAR